MTSPREDARNGGALPAGKLEEMIGYRFKNPALLEEALTHSSYSNECRDRHPQCNERLEFLGDSILSVITAEFLYGEFPKENEGFLTRTRAALVCENTLAVLASEIGLGDYMRFGHGEIVSGGGKQRKSILADAFEALLAALYLDSGMETVRSFLLPRLRRMLREVSRRGTEDYKSMLQRIVQQTPEEELRYEERGEEGPPHNRTFHFAVYLNSNLLGTGSGRTKREAEQEAAYRALIMLGELEEEAD
ncbi:MAG: ribonuclease III [Clostridia bacterium]|nr:ribonuclease III [Clostridia bacterium]